MGKIFKSKFSKVVITSAGTALGVWLGGQIAKLIEAGIESVINTNHGRHAANRKNKD